MKEFNGGGGAREGNWNRTELGDEVKAVQDEKMPQQYTLYITQAWGILKVRRRIASVHKGEIG